jgi:hypothetical protein
MATELKDESVSQYKEEEKQVAVEAPSLQTSLNTLVKYGSYDFLEAVVDGADNLNPVRKAKRSIFLTDASKKQQRAELKKKINLWIDLLTENNSVADMVDKSAEKAETAEKLLKGNLKKVLDSSREMEQSYRSVHLFYKNTESPKLKNVVLMNAAM